VASLASCRSPLRPVRRSRKILILSQNFQQGRWGGFQVDSPVKRPDAGKLARSAPPYTDRAREEPCRGCRSRPKTVQWDSKSLTTWPAVHGSSGEVGRHRAGNPCDDDCGGSGFRSHCGQCRKDCCNTRVRWPGWSATRTISARRPKISSSARNRRWWSRGKWSRPEQLQRESPFPGAAITSRLQRHHPSWPRRKSTRRDCGHAEESSTTNDCWDGTGWGRIQGRSFVACSASGLGRTIARKTNMDQFGL